MTAETRTTYETLWYDERIMCCSWCHFVQFDDDGPNHPAWCDRDAAAAPSGSPS
jgi:hypothetical protein